MMTNQVYAQNIPTPLKDIFPLAVFDSLGVFLSSVLPIVYSIAAVLVVAYFLYGGFLYIISQGDKESITRARAMITHSIIGFIILILTVMILQYIPDLLGLPGFQFI